MSDIREALSIHEFVTAIIIAGSESVHCIRQTIEIIIIHCFGKVSDWVFEKFGQKK